MTSVDTDPGAEHPIDARAGVVSRALAAVGAVVFVVGGAALAAGIWGLSFGSETLTVDLGGCEDGYRGAPNSCRVEWKGQPEEGRLASVIVGADWPEYETVLVRTSPGQAEAVLDHWAVRANLVTLAGLLAGAGIGLDTHAARGRGQLWMLTPGGAAVAAYLATMSASGVL